MADRVVLFLTHADAVALRLAGSCAMAAVSTGQRVDVFLFGPAVPAVVEAHGDPEHPGSLLHQARASGGSCRLLACSAGLVSGKVEPGRAEAALDAVVGWPTVLEWSRGVIDRFFF